MEATDMVLSPGMRAGLPTRDGTPRRRVWRWSQIGQAMGIAALVVGSYLFFSHFVVQSICVTGPSMCPTLQEADIYLVNRLGSLFQTPERGDIVVLKDPTDQAYVVKRIIGVAGDRVDLGDGNIYVNGKKISEPYLAQGTKTFPFTTMTETVQCGPDEFYVLGDNRFLSSDSRSYGPVRRAAIVGWLMH